MFRVQNLRKPAAGLAFAASAAVSALLPSTTLLVGAALAQESEGEGSSRALTIPATRINAGVVGASTSIITAEQIERAPEQSIPEILAREAGVQIRSLFGGNAGASTTVDIRGFGASAASNSVILVNGRRINDLDLQGIDFAGIPRDSIERIEIVRGGSAVVLYGEGVVGGVINIVTKSPARLPTQARVEAGVGSYGAREGSLSASTSSGDHAVSFYGSKSAADGYRQNNKFDQLTGVLTYSQRREWGTLYMNFTADDQSLGLPGGRLVDPTLGINQLGRDPRGATTPFDKADKQGMSGTLGFTYDFAPGVTLITDGGVRQKRQQSNFFGTLVDRASRDPLSYIDATLTTSSLTPRLDVRSQLVRPAVAKPVGNRSLPFGLFLAAFARRRPARHPLLRSLPIFRVGLFDEHVRREPVDAGLRGRAGAVHDDRCARHAEHRRARLVSVGPAGDAAGPVRAQLRLAHRRRAQADQRAHAVRPRGAKLSRAQRR